MRFVRNFGLLLISVVYSYVGEASDVISKYVRFHSNLTLRCPPSGAPSGDGELIQWLDYVHNTDRNPHVIFTSANNTDLLIAPGNSPLKYHLDAEYTLTVSNFTDEDSGSYWCTRNHVETSYRVTVYDVPQCSGETSLIEGNGTLLTCQSRFVGQIESTQLRWVRHSRTAVDQDVVSDDTFDIRLASREVKMASVTFNDDGAVFSCRLSVGDVTEECSLTLNVSNSVHDVDITPADRDTYQPGDEIRCVAGGNPAPEISLKPTSGVEKFGSGWRATIIPESWAHKEVELRCTATNTVAGQTSKLSKTLHLVVTPVRTTTVAPKPNVNTARSQAASMSTGPIVAGIVIGLVILTVIIVAVVCIRLCKERKSKKEMC